MRHRSKILFALDVRATWSAGQKISSTVATSAGGRRTTLTLCDVVARQLARNIGLRSFCCRYVVIGARTVTLGSPRTHLAEPYRTRGDLLNVAGKTICRRGELSSVN
jgi:hypothetical protein